VRTAGSDLLPEKERHRLPIEPRERSQLDHVQPSLTALRFRHKGLMATEALCDFDLRETRVLPSLRQ